MVEVLVSVAIIGILIAVLLPATQTAREAARRMDCSNRMKQVGLAIENYVADWKFYPDGASWRYDLLPYLGETTIYQARGPISDDVFAIWEPIQALTVKVYLCPSDPADVVFHNMGGANYVGCYGSGVLDHGYNGIFCIRDFHNPRIFPAHATKPADVIDGLSNTAMVSELLRMNGDVDSVLRVTYQTPRQFAIGQGILLAEMCDSIPMKPSQYGWRASVSSGRGVPWYNGTFGIGHYNHMLPPNRPSCLNDTHIPTGVHTAASMHPSGVNVLHADGHVQFIAVQIDRETWADLGSRTSGDLITAF